MIKTQFYFSINNSYTILEYFSIAILCYKYALQRLVIAKLN